MYVNAHVVNRMQALPALRDALTRADLVYCDGYGVRLAARAMHLEVPHRMTGADWIWGLASLCELRGQSIYLLGSEPPVAREAAARLPRWYPDLRIAGAHHGYFEPGSPHHERVIEDIVETAPDIVLVGMGTPKQELWADRYADRARRRRRLERRLAAGLRLRTHAAGAALARRSRDGVGLPPGR